ncbi:MAG: glycine zipper domain-containing protein [Candidatus Omnitrophota bacterium]|nr:hypothetical protein [Candidatus Omnitrophota bacterium]
MKKITVFLAIGLLMCLGGCTTVQRGAAAGAVAGGALGAVIGHQSGRTAQGAAIGAGAGGVVGAIVSEQIEKKFCPECGRRFTSSVNVCPYDGTELKIIEKKGN